MAKVSLKTQNLPLLAMIMIAQLLIAYLLSSPDFGWSVIEEFAEGSVVMAAIMLLAALFSSLLPASVKHQLVYLRLNNTLPGHRFLHLAAQDPRIDLLALQHKVMPLMPLNATEAQQNRVWYQHIYHLLQNEVQVKDAHKAFLLWRDGVVVSLVIGLLLALGVFAVPVVAGAFTPYSFLVSVFFALACVLAAHHSGKRMVTNAVVTWMMQPSSNQK